MGVLVLVPLLFYGILRSSKVQTFLAGRLTHYLSTELNAHVLVRGIDISWFMDIELEGLYISDHQYDTLLYVKKIIFDLDKLQYQKKIISINTISLQNPTIRLHKDQSDSLYNFQFLVDYFSSSDTALSTRIKWKASLKGLEIKNSRFSLDNDHYQTVNNQLDYNHLDINRLNINLSKISFLNDSISARINQLSFDEKSGFTLRKMKTDVLFTPTQLNCNNLLIRTDWSNIETDLSFLYDSVSAFNDFVDKVTLKAYLLPSDLDLRDLVFFVPEVQGMKNRFVINGEVDGKISNLKIKDLQVNYGTFSSFHGNIALNGLPLLEETFIQLNIKNFHTNQYDLTSFQLPGGAYLSVPEQLTEMGNITVQGRFTGFYNDFVSYARFKTDIGSVFTDISLKNNSSSGQIEYSGKIRTREFNLGLLLKQQEYFGKVNLTADITGSGLNLDDLLINLDGVVDSLYFKGNTFKEIRISGGILDRRFNGYLQVTDQRLGLDFNGYIDFKTANPVFDFVTSIDHAGLNRLNLVQSDSVMTISTLVKAHFEGLEPDSIRGSLSMDSTVFMMNRSRYFMKRMDFSINPEPGGGKTILLTSDFVNASVKGSYTFDQLEPSLRLYLNRFFPALTGQTDNIVQAKQPAFVFEILLKDSRPFSRMFYPGIGLADNTLITGNYKPDENDVNLKASSSFINIQGISVQNWYMDGLSTPTELQLKTGCLHLNVAENIGLDSLLIATHGKNDTIGFTVTWNNENQQFRNWGDLTGYLSILTPSTFNFNLGKSKTVINDSLWSSAENNMIEIEKNVIRIKNLSYSSGNEQIELNGVVSKDPEDILKITLKHFNISSFDFLTVDQGVDFDGFVNGKLEVLDVFNAPKILSDITINNFAFNKDKLGNAKVITRWESDKQALFAKIDIIHLGNIGEIDPINIYGYYYPMKKENCLDFAIAIKQFNLGSIAGFLSSFSSKFEGIARGNLTLKGNLNKPDLEGIVMVNRGEIRIDYLHTEYSFSDTIELGKNSIRFTDVIARDQSNMNVTINGDIKHDYFRDFKLDLRLKPHQLLMLNTSSSDNTLFYGTAYGTGNVWIHGPGNNLMIDVVAKTDLGTQISLPINTNLNIPDNEFITFSTTTQDLISQQENAAFLYTGVSLNLDVDVTPDATVRIFMPSDMGIIKASGKGMIKMDVDTRGQFSIVGDYEVTEGSFLFTLQNVVNRLFQIQAGGKIIFYGDPYATTINLRAIHKLDVPLTGLRLTEKVASLKKKIPVNCIIDLKGNLFNPELVFKISTPETDPEINRIIFSQLDTNNQQQMSEQMIFLMVLKQFKPLERSNPLDLNASVGSSSWDILSSQLNGWLSQISKDFDIGVNYKPGDRLTNDELSVALSTQLFDERVIIDGNFGYNAGSRSPSTTSQNASNLVGDVKVEVKLTDDGRFRVKAFNKSNNVSLFENNSPYTQGIGIFFRKEFDNIGELFKGRKKKQNP